MLDQVPGPVALFGHSLGALLAFEVGRALTLAGRAPEHYLVVSARGHVRHAVPADPCRRRRGD
ncbi:hypothetical protein GCM10020220_069810 [Nonomuraea rubra]